MRRRLALRAEILARADEAGAEVGLPDAVHEHAGRGRRPAGRPASGRTSAASARDRPGSGCRNGGHAGRDRLAGLEKVAALEHRWSSRGSSRASKVSCRRAVGPLLPERLDPLVGLLQLGHGRPPVAEDGGRLGGRALGRRDGEDLAHVAWAADRRPRLGPTVTVRRKRPRLLFWWSSLFQPPCLLHEVERRARVPAGNATAFAATKTALRRLLRRPGPASMPQAVSSLPSMANSTGPVTRLRARPVVEVRLQVAVRVREVGRRLGELDAAASSPGSPASAASTLNSVSAHVPLNERPGPLRGQVRIGQQLQAEGADLGEVGRRLEVVA